MSRTYEASLTSQLTRLDRWIAESELLASQTSDEETRQNVVADLARWRELRERDDAILQRTKSLNRFVSRTLFIFLFSFALLCITAMFEANGIQKDEHFSFLFIACDLLLVIGSGATYLVAITVRDAVALGRRPWRFSVRSLLIVMTVVALLLGVWFYVRH